MRVQFTYTVTMTYRPDPAWAPGDRRIRTSKVLASSKDRAAEALLSKIRETYRNADMIEYSAV